MDGTASALTGWLLFAALVLVVGAVVARWLVLPRGLATQGVPPSWLEGRAARMGALGAVLLGVALALVFHRQLADFRDPFVPWTEDAELLLTGTPWGAAWTRASAATLVTLAAFVAAARGRLLGWILATGGALVLATFPATTGHAAATEELRAFTLAADTLHVLGAGGWMGGLTLLVVLEWRWQRSPARGGPPSLLPGLVGAFSPVAVACVAAIVVTGAFASWVQLPAPEALWSTDYGRRLLLKVGLALAAFALGALNWRRLTPRLLAGEAPDAMRRAAALELLVAHAVLLVTALLVRTSPGTG